VPTPNNAKVGNRSFSCWIHAQSGGGVYVLAHTFIRMHSLPSNSTPSHIHTHTHSLTHAPTPSTTHTHSHMLRGSLSLTLTLVYVDVGRGGRVCPGTCYKLFTRRQESEMADFETAEILRVCASRPYLVPCVSLPSLTSVPIHQQYPLHSQCCLLLFSLLARSLSRALSLSLFTPSADSVANALSANAFVRLSCQRNAQQSDRTPSGSCPCMCEFE
jgi:hypothetical protein